MNDEKYVEIQKSRADLDIRGPGYGNPKLAVHIKEFIDNFSEYIVEPVLDIGSSDGALVNELNSRGIFTMGIDIVDTCVIKSMMNRNPVFWWNVEEIIPFPDKVFKTVTIFHTLEHTRYPEKVLSNIRRILDGNICIIVPYQTVIEDKYGHMIAIEDNMKLKSYLQGYNVIVEDNKQQLIIAKTCE